MTQSRHIRQESFPPIGPAGQEKLRAGKVLIVGLGALGTHLAELLGRAGVGQLTLIDRDIIELSNLQRQTLFTQADLGRPKALTVREHLLAIDSELSITALTEEFSAENGVELARGQNLVLDGTDNFETRFLINEVAVETGIPWVMAAVVGSYGQIQPIIPQPILPLQKNPNPVAGTANDPAPTACLACLMESPPENPGPTCETAGVIGPAVGVVAALAAAEALKILVGDFAALSGPLFFDLWQNQFHAMRPSPPRPGCAVCGKGERPFLHGEISPTEAVRYCGTRTVQIRPPRPLTLALADLQRQLPAHFEAVLQDGMLRLKSAGSELVLFSNGRALVREVDSPEAARRLYAQVLGM